MTYFYSFFSFLCVLFVSALAGAQATNNYIAIGQGISSPTMTSPVMFSNGWTSENPVGVAYQQSLRASILGSTGDNNSGLGGELGFGNGAFGFAGGYYKNDCDGCDGDFAGAIAGKFSGVAIGLRLTENVYGVGLLFNPDGEHRFGVNADLNDPDGDDNNLRSFGVGYSYVTPQYTITVDASKIDYENDSFSDDPIRLTPGFALHFQKVSLSVNYDTTINKPDGYSDDDDLWVGLGFGDKSSWYLALYHDYVNEWSGSLSFFF